jgi:hypothetical protein
MLRVIGSLAIIALGIYVANKKDEVVYTITKPVDVEEVKETPVKETETEIFTDDDSIINLRNDINIERTRQERKRVGRKIEAGVRKQVIPINKKSSGSYVGRASNRRVSINAPKNTINTDTPIPETEMSVDINRIKEMDSSRLRELEKELTNSINAGYMKDIENKKLESRVKELEEGYRILYNAKTELEDEKESYYGGRIPMDDPSAYATPMITPTFTMAFPRDELRNRQASLFTNTLKSSSYSAVGFLGSPKEAHFIGDFSSGLHPINQVREDSVSGLINMAVEKQLYAKPVTEEDGVVYLDRTTKGLWIIDTVTIRIGTDKEPVTPVDKRNFNMLVEKHNMHADCLKKHTAVGICDEVFVIVTFIDMDIIESVTGHARTGMIPLLGKYVTTSGGMNIMPSQMPGALSGLSITLYSNEMKELYYASPFGPTRLVSHSTTGEEHIVITTVRNNGLEVKTIKPEEYSTYRIVNTEAAAMKLINIFTSAYEDLDVAKTIADIEGKNTQTELNRVKTKQTVRAIPSELEVKARAVATTLDVGAKGLKAGIGLTNTFIDLVP